MASLIVDAVQYKDYSQATQSKHKHQGKFLLPRQVNCQQCRNGNDQDSKIGCDMHTSVREPQARFAQTRSLDCRIPELGNGDTIKECTDDRPSTVDAEDGDHDPANDAHSVGWEDAEVLH